MCTNPTIRSRALVSFPLCMWTSHSQSKLHKCMTGFLKHCSCVCFALSLYLLKSRSYWVRRDWKTMGISLTHLPLLLLTFHFSHITCSLLVPPDCSFSCISVHLESAFEVSLLIGTHWKRVCFVCCTFMLKCVTGIHQNIARWYACSSGNLTLCLIQLVYNGRSDAQQ